MKAFAFFLADKKASANSVQLGSRKVKKEYTIEYPLKSGNYILDKEKMIKELNATGERRFVAKKVLICYNIKCIYLKERRKK